MRVGPEGIEPTPCGLKVRCAAFTPRPHKVGRAYAFQSLSTCHFFFSFLFRGSVVALGIELSATRLSAGYGQPALDYLIKVGHPGVEPRPSCSQNRCASICTSTRNFLSVRTAGLEPTVSWPPTRRDNQASLRSDQVVASSPYGNRTHLTALKERHPLPIDERAMLCAYRDPSGPGGARILVCGSSDRR